MAPQTLNSKTSALQTPPGGRAAREAPSGTLGGLKCVWEFGPWTIICRGGRLSSHAVEGLVGARLRCCTPVCCF